MDSLGKKAGYLKGLMEGLKFEDPGQEKLMLAIVDLLGEICDRTEGVEDLVSELNDYVESIDDDLTDLEQERADGFSLLDEDDLADDFDEMDSSSPRLHLIGGGKRGEGSPEGELDGEDEDELDDEDEDDDFDEDDDGVTVGAVACPECKQPFFVSLFDPEGSIYVCPHCGYRGRPMLLDASNSPIAYPVDEE